MPIISLKFMPDCAWNCKLNGMLLVPIQSTFKSKWYEIDRHSIDAFKLQNLVEKPTIWIACNQSTKEKKKMFNYIHRYSYSIDFDWFLDYFLFFRCHTILNRIYLIFRSLLTFTIANSFVRMIFEPNVFTFNLIQWIRLDGILILNC